MPWSSSYIEDAAVAVMDVMRSCRCCLRRAADRDLTTPYTHLGTTEIYSDMLKECFNLHLAAGGDGSCGICSACVGRLRDASDFKLQVQRSQAELRARLQGALPVEDEKPEVKSEEADADAVGDESVCDDLLHEDHILKLELEDETIQEAPREEPPVKPEMLDEDGTDEVLGSEMADGDGTSDEDDPVSHDEARVKAERADADETDDEMSLMSALARSQLDMTCSVRLERLRGDEAPHASHASLATLHESRRASRMKETHDNTAGHRAEETYVCDMCNKQFRSKTILIRHIKTHVELKRYSCGVSNESFKSSKLKKHIIIHTGIKSYSCGECKKQFTTKSHLNRHERIHTGVKPYSCGECKKQFRLKGQLDAHKRIHTGDKPYGCGECKKRFTEKGTLIKHERIHNGVKPYSCGECKKRFTKKSDLNRHKRTHTGVKPYSCEQCHKRFTQKGHLDEHKRIHTGVKPYSCGECKKRFTQKSYLNVHKRIHTGETPYRCEVCNKLFRYRGDIVKHIRTVHSEEQPYMCGICESLFPSKSSLIKHIRIHMNSNS